MRSSFDINGVPIPTILAHRPLSAEAWLVGFRRNTLSGVRRRLLPARPGSPQSSVGNPMHAALHSGSLKVSFPWKVSGSSSSERVSDHKSPTRSAQRSW